MRRGNPMMFGAAMAAVMGAIGMASTGPNMPIMIVDEQPTPSINVNKRRKKARSTGYIHKLPRSKREAGRRNKKTNRLHVSRKAKSRLKRRAA